MSTPTPSPELKRIGQIALSVRDLDRAIAFYRDVLGIKFLLQAPNVAFFDIGGQRLMLGQTEAPKLKPAGTVLYYEVDDLDANFNALKERGAQVEQEPHFIAKFANRELWMAFFRDPDNHLFALISEKSIA